LIFGPLADSIGRRRTTLIAVSGFGVVTLAIGVLPGYAQWGYGSIALLVALRFLDGVFLGGEYSGANVLAMEETPHERRGLVGALIQSGSSVAYIVMSGLTLLMLQIARPGSVDSPYSQWGWRIPFFVGAALSLAFVFYYRTQVEESSVWEKSHAGKTSVLSLFRGSSGRSFLQVFLLMSGMWFLLNCITAPLPGILVRVVDLSSKQVSLVQIIQFGVLLVLWPLGGLLSQRFGRRTYLVTAGALAAIVGIPAYALLISRTGGNLGLAALFASTTGLFITLPWATVVPYISERFRTTNRATGYGLGYSLAVIIPSFYATYQGWLSPLVPSLYTVLVLVGIGAVLVVVGAAIGPETRDVRFEPEGTTADHEGAGEHTAAA
jgi:MFS family permease